MPSDKAMRVAEILLNGQTYMFTEFGRKTQTGIADMIDREVLGYSPDDELPDELLAVCPNCNHRGSLFARKDAFINLPIPANGIVNWDDRSDVSVYDECVYECQECGQQVEESDIERVNNFQIK